MKTLATSAEDEIARYDAEIAEVRAQLPNLAAGASFPEARRIRSRAARLLAALEQGRAIAVENAQRVWDATLNAHNVHRTGGAA